jgi:tripartite-type tricarboxylate transporter receptor subunit TctC
MVAVLNLPEIREVLFRQGLDAHPSTPEAFGKYIQAETAKWARVIKASGAKPE